MCAFVRSDLILLHSWDGKGLYLSASTLVHPGVTDPDTLEACREGIALGLIKRYHIAMDCLNVVKKIVGGCIWCTEVFGATGTPVAHCIFKNVRKNSEKVVH